MEQQVTALVEHIKTLTVSMQNLSVQHQAELQQRDLQIAEMKGAMTAMQSLTARSTGENPNRSDLLDPKILHKVQPCAGRRSNWKTFEFQWRAYLIAQDRRYRDLWMKTDNTTEAVSHVDPTKDEEDLSVQLHFARALVTPKESVGELIVRNVSQGEGALSWRMLMTEYAANESGNALAAWAKLADLRFQPGADIVVGVNRLEEDMTRYQKMSGETLSDTIKRGILMKALSNEPELQRRVFRNTA